MYLAENDTLIVTSADSSAVTKYVISLGSLSSDAVLWQRMVRDILLIIPAVKGQLRVLSLDLLSKKF